jgi:thiamine-monophosphate kinase
MGGEARWAMFSLGVPEATWNSDFLDRFYVGAYQLARKFGVEIVGGDVSRTRYGLAIDSVVGGDVPRGGAVRRIGAHPGDLILVTGDLGGSAAGLRLLREGLRYGDENEKWQDELLLKHLEPWPQMGNGLLLQMDDTATAMIDISDGLSSDLSHICRTSGVGAKIVADRIPVHSCLKYLGLANEDILALALNGGEDFELLFTAREENISAIDEELFTVIGEVTANIGVMELVRDEASTILPADGFRHF